MVSQSRPRARFLSLFATLPIAVACALVVVYVGGLGGAVSGWRVGLAVVVALGVVGLPLIAGLARGFAGVGVIALGSLGFWGAQAPSNERVWEEPSSRTAWAVVDGRQVTVHDVRDFRYQDDGTWVAGWYDATYDLADIEQSYLVLTRFGGVEGLAHVMVSFRFKGDRFIVLSVEIRREEGESYDPIGGALRQYELFYVAADERDALALRTHVHKDDTWVIPMNAGTEKTGEFFMSMVERMTALHEAPEWYNSLTNSCSSNLADHYQSINEVSFPPDYRILLPGFSDALLSELDLLPEGVSVEQARALFRVNDVAAKLPVDDRYSVAIRGRE
ncbi:MAG: DUF4105 domain-containing protein [Bradymonadaceae bacterium]|nr:DUF4105 domain-containing protein [Lujinxingiaceae bacterium]